MDIKDTISNVLGLSSNPNPINSSDTEQFKEIAKLLNLSYSTDNASTNWYQARPYGFKFTARDGKVYSMFLPISPNNLTITTHYATNVLNTLYGTVEEHSEQRYFDIVIEGTTGIAPRYVRPRLESSGRDVPDETKGKSQGRLSFATRQKVPIDGFLKKTIGTAAKIASTAVDAVDKLISNINQNSTGVSPANSGWAAFHNLYRFFMVYKRDTAGIGSKIKSRKDKSAHPLIFFNYKDNNQYSVSMQRFMLRRTADNPMLYNYSIVLRGYNIESAGSKPPAQSLNDRLRDTGLDGIDGSSVFTDMKTASSSMKSIIGAAGGFIRNAGS